MMILNALFFLIWCISVNTRYVLYYSNVHQSSSYRTFDCLYAYLVDGSIEVGKRYIQNYHLIPYCRRPDDDDDNEEEDNMINLINENIEKRKSFKELKEENITSEQLLEWFVPIDIAEKYEMNLNDLDIFYNCSLPWFGSHCQYKFDYDLSLSFSDIIRFTFTEYYKTFLNITNGTCYRFLTGCNRDLWPFCLDWREICDGKIDCINGEDENWCDQLEMSQCNSNEYRCHYGGQCIPLSFLKDSQVSIDCLDGSDELNHYSRYGISNNPTCPLFSTFKCQERIGRYLWSFQCGDGEYIIDIILPIAEVICLNRKEIELSRAMLTSMDHISDINCQKAFYCALHFNRVFGLIPGSIVIGANLVTIVGDVWNEDCELLSQHCLSEWVVIPSQPILFGLFQFIYFTNRSINEFKRNIKPDFICFNDRRCPILLMKIVPIEMIKGLTCFHSSNLIANIPMGDFRELYSFFFTFNAECLKTGIDKSCKNSSYFHCIKSMKCIPYHRVVDGMYDCYFGEDELFDACQLNDSKRYKCQGNSSKCLSPVAVGNGIEDCPLKDDEIFIYTQDIVILVPFPHLCNKDGNDDLFSLKVIETDETNCDWWPCNNIYTRCDKHWNCLDGVDELNCPYTTCSSNEHQCLNIELQLSYCISLSHIYEKYINNCNDRSQDRLVYFYNETTDISEHYISWNNSKCVNLDKLCRVNRTSLTEKDVCLYLSPQSTPYYAGFLHFFKSNETLCYMNFISISNALFSYYFKATRLGYLPEISMDYSISNISKSNQTKTSVSHNNTELILYCHRGILVRTGRNQTKKCFCPPNYFGSQCQWQNQRISLTIQLFWRSTEFKIVIFQVIILLIDENKEITSSYEQLTYMPNRDCNTKFNIYLLYPDRPKSLSNKYSIRIDLYEKTKLKYWASWLINIPFQFLPVNRIVTQLIIPEIETNEECTHSCGEHGICRHYINNKFLFFCQCHNEYSGSQCQIKRKCNCAKNSFCFNSSICICLLHKFGSYCHLTHSICQSSNNSCQHNGVCVPTDDRIGLKQFTCLCPDDYSGERCEIKNNRIDIHLNEQIILNTSLLRLHFITTFTDTEHERRTILKKIPFDNKNLTIYVTQSFNILFIQTIPNQYYYLAVLREIFLPTEHIYTEIQTKQRCLSIDELNKTLSKYKYLQRTKYYPLLCRNYSELKCFYDDDLMCICDIDRFSNCFMFNHKMNNDCQDYNYCENAGQCFQNNETCPTKFTCTCEDCYYGAKCQFSTKGFIFSLDSILGYHIKPNISINQQSLIIKISIGITTIMFILGLINGLLSFVVFRRKKTKQVGTGYYLLFSSITSIFIIILLEIKFWELIFSQISLITNRSFLYFNCISIDTSLKILLALNEWLNACVAFERMITAIRGTLFNRKISRKISKWIIPNLFLIIILTYIHDPIHRELIDDLDIDETRIWCFIKYSPTLQIYNSFITLFHFFVPFVINIISAIWIILKISYKRSGVQRDQTFQQHLYRQIKDHRHVLIASCVLIILNLPRLIISFLSGCMRSAREPWLYLIGYFISFVPSMLTLVVFILPSKTYKDELDIVIEQTMKKFRNYFR